MGSTSCEILESDALWYMVLFFFSPRSVQVLVTQLLRFRGEKKDISSTLGFFMSPYELLWILLMLSLKGFFIDWGSDSLQRERGLTTEDKQHVSSPEYPHSLETFKFLAVDITFILRDDMKGHKLFVLLHHIAEDSKNSFIYFG